MGKYQNVNLSNLGFMNGFSKDLARNNFRIEKIPYDKIITNIKNKYSIEKIEELEFSILHNGLKQNLEVKENSNGTYTLISGERRYTALCNLISQGHDEFELIPCLVTDTEQAAVFLNDNGDEILTSEDKEDWAIVTTNSENREFTDSDRAFQVSTLKRIYRKLADGGVKLPGRISELIADNLGMSIGQVKNLQFIETHGSDELKSKLNNNEISIGAATQVAHLSAAQQKAILSNDNVTSSTVKKHQEKTQKKKINRKENSVFKENKTIPLSESKKFQDSLSQFNGLYNQFIGYDFNSLELSKEDIDFLVIKLNLSIKNLDSISRFFK